MACSYKICNNVLYTCITEIRRQTCKSIVASKNTTMLINSTNSTYKNSIRNYCIPASNAHKNKIRTRYSKPLNSDQEKTKIVNDDVIEVGQASDGTFKYKKLKPNDAKISTLMLLVKSKKRRLQRDFILLEGKRLIRDGLLAGCIPKALLFSRINDLHLFKNIFPKTQFPVYQLSYNDLQLWSNLTTCPGIMGIFSTPDTTKRLPADNSLPLTVIGDNIREPGNLGAIIRNLAAVGCKKLILTKGCVDLWDPKVLRSASGAHFKLTIEANLVWDQVHDQLDPKSAVFIADNISPSQDLDFNQPKPIVSSDIPVLAYSEIEYNHFTSLTLVIGGETEGISKEAYQLAMDTSGCRVQVPLMNDVDSLNSGTALGIIAFEMRKQFNESGQIHTLGSTANAINQ